MLDIMIMKHMFAHSTIISHDVTHESTVIALTRHKATELY
jgi:hypothetical protein